MIENHPEPPKPTREEMLERFLKVPKSSLGQTGGITADIVEITKWGHDKGWDIPALCEHPGDPTTNEEPTGLNVPAIMEKLMLVVTEISEAVEELRDGEGHLALRIEDDGKPEGLTVELADAYIRMAHLCGMLGLDLEEAVHIKKAYNMGRPYRHGGRLA